MTERDPRWENVRASIKPHEQSAKEFEMNIFRDTVKIEMRVVYRMQAFSSTRLLSKEMIRYATFPMINWTLDDMVLSIDEMMNSEVFDEPRFKIPNLEEG